MPLRRVRTTSASDAPARRNINMFTVNTRKTPTPNVVQIIPMLGRGLLQEPITQPASAANKVAGTRELRTGLFIPHFLIAIWKNDAKGAYKNNVKNTPIIKKGPPILVHTEPSDRTIQVGIMLITDKDKYSYSLMRISMTRYRFNSQSSVVREYRRIIVHLATGQVLKRCSLGARSRRCPQWVESGQSPKGG